MFECLTRLQGPQARCPRAWGLHLVGEITDLIWVRHVGLLLLFHVMRGVHMDDDREGWAQWTPTRGFSKAYTASSAAASQ